MHVFTIAQCRDIMGQLDNSTCTCFARPLDSFGVVFHYVCFLTESLYTRAVKSVDPMQLSTRLQFTLMFGVLNISSVKSTIIVVT